jgi:hypothetical protein
MFGGPTATLHALPLPELKLLLADYPACILITTPTAMWPFYIVVEDMLKQQYNIHLYKKKLLGLSR